MHRNTFLNSPRLLDEHFMLKGSDNIFFGGQITGVEGYIESAASGIMAGRALADRLDGKQPLTLPRITMMGALADYIAHAWECNFQPMGSNMGILPPLSEEFRGKDGKQRKYAALAQRALNAVDSLLQERGD